MKKLMLGLVAAFAFGAVAAPVFAEEAAGGDKADGAKKEKKGKKGKKGAEGDKGAEGGEKK
jgi:hypothetical protein